MELWIGSINLGFLYGFLAFGMFISYKVFKFADITVDGSFTTGAAVAAVAVFSGFNPYIALAMGFVASAFAGFLTAVINTKFKINEMLAAILVMTGLYSVNLRIMKKSNVPLMNTPGFMDVFYAVNPGLNKELWLTVCLITFTSVFWILLSLFFKTNLGIAMRAAGSNPEMVKANGVNVDKFKILGIVLANGFFGLSGGLVAQYQGFADITMGIGSIVFGLAAVIIGESLIKSRSVFLTILSVVVGSLIFRLMFALALFAGLNPNDLKLIMAVFVLIILVASSALTLSQKSADKKSIKTFFARNQKSVLVCFVILIVLVVTFFTVKDYLKEDVKRTKIGIMIGSNADILINTRDGFISEMNKLGYVNGQNIEFIEMNANNDLPTLNAIADNFIKQKVDIVLTISTASTQAAYNKIKNIPVVFATVADPFILGVGSSDSSHAPNVTGVYGALPVDGFLDVVSKFFNKKFKIGTVWNPSFPNSVFYVDRIHEELHNRHEISFEGATITNSGDVYQAAMSLVHKNIDCFFLTPDITVFDSFESVSKVSEDSKIPIFTADVECLKKGALLVYGYEYQTSGWQAAHICDKILKGTNPADIPFEKYKTMTIGVNYDVARKLYISVPAGIKNIANRIFENGQIINISK